MVVGLANITFRLHQCHSLKSKRKVVKAIVQRIRNHFNASVAEVNLNDVHQRAQIGIAMVANDKKVVNAKLDKLFNQVDELGLAEIIDSDMEIFKV